MPTNSRHETLWYQEISKGKFNSIVELRQVFPSADKVGKLTVFNIGGNKVRLIAAIHYNRSKVYLASLNELDKGIIIF